MYYYSFTNDNSLSLDDNDELFLKMLFNRKVTEIQNFLEHHFAEYKGDSEDFIDHTEMIIDEYVSQKEIDSKKPFTMPKFPVNDGVKKQIDKWLTKKRSYSLYLKSEAIPVERIKKTSIKERFVYLKELGFFELKSFSECTQNKKEKFLSKILDCNIDYARDLLNINLHRYGKDEKNGIKSEMIDMVKNDINQVTK